MDNPIDQLIDLTIQDAKRRHAEGTCSAWCAYCATESATAHQIAAEYFYDSENS